MTRLTACLAIVLATHVSAFAQTPADLTDRALERLLERASVSQPGTYAITGETLDWVDDRAAVVVQADVLRGARAAARDIRVPIALGAVVDADARVRLQVVAANAPTRRVAEAEGTLSPQRSRLIHEFTLAPGAYEIHCVVRHRRGNQEVVSLAKQPLQVADVWNTPLALSPIVLGDGVLQAEAAAGPFTFGASRLSPARTTQFSRAEEIDLAFRIFNWTRRPDQPQDATPDLTVEYAFFQRNGTKKVFFNKVRPQRVTADTLGRTFDPATGMVASGMRVPLLAFPFGDFELRLRVTDNRSHRTTEQHVRFVVGP